MQTDIRKYHLVPAFPYKQELVIAPGTKSKSSSDRVIKYRLIPATAPQPGMLLSSIWPGQDSKSKKELMENSRSWRKKSPPSTFTTKSWDITMDDDEIPKIVPKFNNQCAQRIITGDCICVFCGFRFFPERTSSATFMSDTYAGLDNCPRCCGQGGIIRTHCIELDRLPQIRAAVIDLITTQNRKMRWCSDSAKEIDPIWDSMAYPH